MQITIASTRRVGTATTPPIDFNFSKLVAVLCMAASAATSIVIIVWGVRGFS
jgi:hypothetical protein